MKLRNDELELFWDYDKAQRSDLDHQLDLTESVLEICESPVEQRFLLAFLRYYSAAIQLYIRDDLTCFVELDYACFLAVAAQERINIDRHSYRVDFLLALCVHYPFSVRSQLVIEIDGHAFHERTKEQAQRDKSRDRALVANGYTVMRFTGSEVFKNADALILEVAKYFEKETKKRATECNFTLPGESAE